MGMGPDIERILGEVEAVNVAIDAAIKDFSGRCAYQLTHYGPHDVVVIPWSPPCYPIELEYPVGGIMGGINAAFAALSADIGKLSSMQGNMFASASQITNSISSPWNELNNFAKDLADANTYEGSFVPFNYLGEKVGMLGHLNNLRSAIIDCKAPLMIYYDWLQRGFDHQMNGNSPSITYTDTLNGGKTIGQGKQSYSGAVAVPQPSNNPY